MSSINVPKATAVERTSGVIFGRIDATRSNALPMTGRTSGCRLFLPGRIFFAELLELVVELLLGGGQLADLGRRATASATARSGGLLGGLLLLGLPDLLLELGDLRARLAALTPSLASSTRS